MSDKNTSSHQENPSKDSYGNEPLSGAGEGSVVSRLPRRSVVKLLLATGGAAFLGGTGFFLERQGLTSLTDFFSDEEAVSEFDGFEDHLIGRIRFLGKSYVTDHEPKVDFPALEKRLNAILLRGLDNDEEGHILNMPAIYTEIERAVLRDYEHENFLLLNKWLFTRTEAWLCAYYYLRYGNAKG